MDQCPFNETLVCVLAHIGDYGHIIVLKAIMNSPIYDTLPDGTQRRAYLSYEEIQKHTGFHSRSLNAYLSFLTNGHFVFSQYVTVNKKRFLIYGIRYKDTIDFVTAIFDHIHKRILRSKDSWFCEECAQTFDIAQCIDDQFEISCPNSKHHHLTNSTSLRGQQECVEQLMAKLSALKSLELKVQYTIAPFGRLE